MRVAEPRSGISWEKEVDEEMMIYRLSYGKFAILNIFAQIVCVFQLMTMPLTI